MTEADEDLLVASDAEMLGRHDVAEQLRARHLGAERAAIMRLVEDYRIQLGLLPWAEHAAWAAGQVERWRKYNGPSYRPDRDRRSGRSTRAMLEAIARCQVYGRRLLAVVGDRSLIRKLGEDMALDFLVRLRIDLLVANVHDVTRLCGKELFVVYEDHSEFQGPISRTHARLRELGFDVNSIYR